MTDTQGNRLARSKRSMEEVTFQIMRDKPVNFEDLLSMERILLVRKEGKPFAVVIDVSEDSISTIVQTVSQVRAQMAVSSMRSEASESGRDELTPEEIRAVRSKR